LMGVEVSSSRHPLSFKTNYDAVQIVIVATHSAVPLDSTVRAALTVVL
jgi:hypothetical protein